MDARGSRCSRKQQPSSPDGNAIATTTTMDGGGRCLKCAASSSFKYPKKTSSLSSDARDDERETTTTTTAATKVPVKPPESDGGGGGGCCYVVQIVSIGVRPDGVYEARMLLAPEVDVSSIKITVKGNNLRVNVSRPVDDRIVGRLPKISEKSVFGDVLKKIIEYCENLLVPEGIDGEKVRAVVDNKRKLLVLTAPAMKPSKTRKKIIGKN